MKAVTHKGPGGADQVKTKKPITISLRMARSRDAETMPSLSLMEADLEHLKSLVRVSEAEFRRFCREESITELRIEQVGAGWSLLFGVEGHADRFTVATWRNESQKVWKSVDTLLRLISESTGIKDLTVKLE